MRMRWIIATKEAIHFHSCSPLRMHHHHLSVVRTNDSYCENGIRFCRAKMQSSTGPVVVRSGEGWEIVNDDGLIYKRQKRELNLSSEVHDPPVQPHIDKHWRRNRKKASLQQLKSRYLAEIEEWEKLFQKLDKPSESKDFQKELPNLTVLESPIVDLSEEKFKNMVEKLSYQ
ncbi:hypothetical protein GOP47_0000158, partial [Adiantum capillus-veneris]